MCVSVGVGESKVCACVYVCLYLWGWVRAKRVHVCGSESGDGCKSGDVLDMNVWAVSGDGWGWKGGRGVRRERNLLDLCVAVVGGGRGHNAPDPCRILKL